MGRSKLYDQIRRIIGNDGEMPEIPRGDRRDRRYIQGEGTGKRACPECTGAGSPDEELLRRNFRSSPLFMRVKYLPLHIPFGYVR